MEIEVEEEGGEDGVKEFFLSYFTARPNLKTVG